MGRVLGVHHSFEKELDQNGNGTTTETTIEMDGYIQDSLDMYNEVPGSEKWPLKDCVHYPWYEPTQQEIDTLGQQPGVFADNSASLLMRALCGRTVRHDICYTIITLSKYITKWSALCDKQIRHLYSYLNPTATAKLQGKVDAIDFKNAKIQAYPDADLAGMTPLKLLQGGS